MMTLTYLTTGELSSRIQYEPRAMRDRLKDSVLLEGTHYIRPFGVRKILHLWEKAEKEMFKCGTPQSFADAIA